MRNNKKGEFLAQSLAQDGISNTQVLQTIAAIPRHVFVPDALAHKAFENTALPIGQGQTISQPYIVAKMTELLLERIAPTSAVLEIGTGSGYQSAVLASIFTHVFSVERIKSLQFQAKRRLNRLNLHNVKMKHADGWQGWQNKAPFDAIIVTAAAEKMPSALVEQLNNNGRLVIPVGNDLQQLLCVDKDEHGNISEQTISAVNFVPLVAGDLG